MIYKIYYGIDKHPENDTDFKPTNPSIFEKESVYAQVLDYESTSLRGAKSKATSLMKKDPRFKDLQQRGYDWESPPRWHNWDPVERALSDETICYTIRKTFRETEGGVWTDEGTTPRIFWYGYLVIKWEETHETDSDPTD